MNRFDFLTNDKCVGRIFTTTNYAKFRLDELNRPLDAKHANNLYEKLVKGPHITLEPITVSPNYTIIDGQHRFYALSKAGLPINYYVDNQIKINDAPALNSKAKNWAPLDYIKVFANYGNKNYQALLNVCKEYGKFFSTSTLASIMTSTHQKDKWGGIITREIKNNKFNYDFSHEHSKKYFLTFVVSLKPQLKIKSSHKIPRKLLDALHPWYFNSHVNEDRLRRVVTIKYYKQLTGNYHLDAYNLGLLYNRGLTKNAVPCYLNPKGKFTFAR